MTKRYARVRYTHYADFGCTMQPSEADAGGFLRWRDGFQAWPKSEWTDSERWVADMTNRVEEWREGVQA